jgi:UDPglucose--hexose-1-phosphate uridylyltransferase
MSDLRFDPLGRRHVLLAPERARRGAPSFEPFRPDPEPCDFCGGHEDQTPPETFSIRAAKEGPGSAPDTPGWSVRVVPNLYPATSFHEVIIHSPHHNLRFENHETHEREDIVRAYRARVAAAPTPSVVAAWNRGRAAGASRSHPHGQLFGLDAVPPTLERESVAFEASPCVLCTFASDPELLIVGVDGFKVIAHPVPYVADEVLIVPPCTPRFGDLDDEQLPSAAEAISSVMRRAMAYFGESLPFNMLFHTAPRDVERFHWHAHLMPRLAVWGGLEMGAELPIVAADPYDTARKLRAA